MVIVVMGVSGAGKTEVGRALAARLDAPFIEADELHPESSVRKMESGRPLDDADRAPWLARVRESIERHLGAGEDAVVACSALKRSYREVLRREGEGVVFVHLRAERAELKSRLERRASARWHYMPPGLLESQLATLEPPGPGEAAIEVEAGGRSVEAIAEAIMGRLRIGEAGEGGGEGA